MKRGIWIKIRSGMANERGLAFMSTLIVGTVLGLGALAFLITSTNSASSINKQIASAKALFNAESLAQWAQAKLTLSANWQNVSWASNPPHLPEGVIPGSTTVQVSSVQSGQIWSRALTINGLDANGNVARKTRLIVYNANPFRGGDNNTPAYPGYAFNYALCACDTSINSGTNGHGLEMAGTSDSYLSSLGNYGGSNIGRRGAIGSNGLITMKGNSTAGNVNLLGDFYANGTVDVYVDNITAKGYFSFGGNSHIWKVNTNGGNVSARGAYGVYPYTDSNNTTIDGSLHVGQGWAVPSRSSSPKTLKGTVVGCIDNSFLYTAAYVCPCAAQLEFNKALSQAKAYNDNSSINTTTSNVELRGTYHTELYVKSGILQLQHGIYYFTKITASNSGDDCRIRLANNSQNPRNNDNDVIIYLDDPAAKLNLKGDYSSNNYFNRINFGQGLDTNDNMVRVNIDHDYSGNQQKYVPNFRIYTNTRQNITMNASALYLGTLYAPYASFKGNGNAEVYGAILANKIDTGGTFKIHFDGSTQYKQDLPIAGTGYPTSTTIAWPRISLWQEISTN